MRVIYFFIRRVWWCSGRGSYIFSMRLFSSSLVCYIWLVRLSRGQFVPYFRSLHSIRCLRRLLYIEIWRQSFVCLIYVWWHGDSILFYVCDWFLCFLFGIFYHYLILQYISLRFSLARIVQGNSNCLIIFDFILTS